MKSKKLPAGQFRNDDGTIALVVCPKCKAENYALNVPSGICTWCGYNVNDTNFNSDERQVDINNPTANECI